MFYGSMESLTTRESDQEEEGSVDTDAREFVFSTCSFSPTERDCLRRRLKYYFMSPIEKRRAKGKVPFKLGAQFVKIILVSLMVYSFGVDMSRFLTHQETMNVSFREIFLRDWDASREVTTYPPSAGPLAVYKFEDLYGNIDNAVRVLSNLTSISLGSFGYSTGKPDEVSPIVLVIRRYTQGETFPHNFTYRYDTTIIEDIININVSYPAGDANWENFSIEEYLKKINMELNLSALSTMSLKFQLQTIYLNSLSSFAKPECYLLNIEIVFDNSLHGGQVPVTLNTESSQKNCHPQSTGTRKISFHYSIILVYTVLIMCISSLMMCLRSLVKGALLLRETMEFFWKNYAMKLNFEDKLDFIDFWIVVIIINDILLIIGCCLKLLENSDDLRTLHMSNVPVLFGIGIFLVYAGVLRYLSYFQKYNILILTIKKALPDVMRFALCAFLLYCGFCLCGWLVLGPYHIKFRTLSQTSECLFSLLNGDDMFATFSILSTGNPLVWWFSRLYLYVFSSLFIYVVLSLFVSIIMDCWDTIKNAHNVELSDLHKFIAECNEDIFEDFDNEPSVWAKISQYVRQRFNF